MSRSYLFVQGKLSNEIMDADAIVIKLNEYCAIQKNELEFNILKEFKKENKKVYLSIDTYNVKKSYSLLNMVDYSCVDGWLIEHANCSMLNRFSMKARENEVSNRLNYGSISFIASVDTPDALIKIRKLAKYDRVFALHLNLDEYINYLGVDNSDSEKIKFLRERVSLENDMAKKLVIDTFCDDDASLENEILYGKGLGFYAKGTYKASQLKTINKLYTPSEEEIKHAEHVLDTYDKMSKKEKKHCVIDGVNYSINALVKCNMNYDRAYNLGLVKNSELTYTLKDDKLEKVKPYNIKKFYTMGEEIGNACSHGVGIALSIAFLVLLLIKGIGNHDVKATIAYSVFALSAFGLYLMSTLYHALPTGSKGKALFQRFDHMTIYLLIAGTYTPYCLLVLNGTLGIILCIYLWVGALIGFSLNLFCWGRFKKFHMFLYIALGWTAILFLPQLYSSLGMLGTILLIGGGVSYTLGVIFYSMKLFKYTHMIWHFFVIGGTVLQFFSIYLCL